jgi:PKD repeat protein
MSCETELASLKITCTSSSSNIQPDSQNWQMGGAGSFESGGDTFSSAVYTYEAPGEYTVTLTVTGLDGTTPSVTDTVFVPGL